MTPARPRTRTEALSQSPAAPPRRCGRSRQTRRRAAFREKRFPELDVDGSADDRIVHSSWHGHYAAVAALEQEFRASHGDGSAEWYRVEGEGDAYWQTGAVMHGMGGCSSAAQDNSMTFPSPSFFLFLSPLVFLL